MPLRKSQKAPITNIALIGFSGAGKTTVSKELESLLNTPIYSIDKIIVEQSGEEITNIFSKYGESYFRNLETQVIADIVSKKHGVIDCGGGVVEREENMDLLKRWGKIIWLDCPLEVIESRTTDGNRPLIVNKNKQQLREFYIERRNLYLRHHHHRVDSSKDFSEVVMEIWDYLQK